MIKSFVMVGCVFVHGLAHAQADGAMRPTPKVGDVSVYLVNNRAENKQSEETVTITAVESGVIKAKHLRTDRNPPELEGITTPELNPVISGASGSKFEPAIELYRFPMKVGDTWKARSESTNQEGSRSRVELEVKVAAQEKLTTPAGEFDTFRIETGGWVTGVSWQGAIRTSQIIWYAPAIGRTVKFDYKDYRNTSLSNSSLVELKSHKPAP